MRILIVANNPRNIGGVMNYTRPLASAFSTMGHEVFYLFSGTWDYHYDLYFKPYLQRLKSDFPFQCAEIVNSVNLSYNYGYPELDITDPAMEQVIGDYLDEIKPDIMHIHSRVGLPNSINMLAWSRGIKVVNTIHTYGYICQKRVMIDRAGDPCFGPKDLNRCAECTGTLNYKVERMRALVTRCRRQLDVAFPQAYNLLRKSKQHVRRLIDGDKDKPRENAAPPRVAKVASNVPRDLGLRLERRLRDAVQMLNSYCHVTLCVSQDVKRTMMACGVREDKLVVQHIGSVIAESQKRSSRIPGRPLVIGNIGGINHYKGTAVLLDAIRKLHRDDYQVRIFGRYNGGYLRSTYDENEQLPVQFTGVYKPADLPAILEQVDIMVLPSICNDTAPQTIFESFSGGVPIIASDIGGFPDFVRHGENGLLFQAGNSDELADRLAFILDNRSEISRYRKNIPRLKTIVENAQELVTLYGELLEEAPARVTARSAVSG